MIPNQKKTPFVAIACGGTGGHLFPGLAVAGELRRLGCDVALLISPKEVDQQAVKSARERSSAVAADGQPAGAPFEVYTLPAVALQNGNYLSFMGSFIKSLLAARGIFRRRQPHAVLAMGSFTSAPPVLAAKFFAAKKVRAKTFLHESNTIPGRANRFLSRFVDEAFVGFPETTARLEARKTTTTGTPVRPEFQFHDPVECRAALGLDPGRPTILVVGGSQGASGLNAMVLSALPLLAAKDWQWLHLTGVNDFEKVKTAYAGLGVSAVVRPFLGEMDLALGAATAAVSRAGASSLAEIAAVRLPALLVPFPAAADNHQFFNARIYAMSGAARLLEQKDSTPEKVSAILIDLVEDAALRSKMDAALELWHAPQSAEQIAANILRRLFKPGNAAAAERRHGHFDAWPGPPAKVTRRMIMLDATTHADEIAACVSSSTSIRRDEPMARHTTLRVGGPADVYVEPANEDDLAAVLKFCGARGFDFFILGRGSNLLVRDGGFRGLVICLAQPEFARIEIDGLRLHCGAGARLKNVAVEARRNGICGLEFLEGIPGSVGGALRMNAGAMGGAMFDTVESVRVMDYEGTVRELPPSEMSVAYRGCATLKTRVALGAVLCGRPDSVESIAQRMSAFSQKRWSSQPAAPSAGCMFKNPPTIPAGRLIDELGLKGTCVGGARISQEHGNFLVNDGNATAAQVLELIGILQARALAERGIELHPEVEIVGEP